MKLITVTTLSPNLEGTYVSWNNITVLTISGVLVWDYVEVTNSVGLLVTSSLTMKPLLTEQQAS